MQSNSMKLNWKADRPCPSINCPLLLLDMGTLWPSMSIVATPIVGAKLPGATLCGLKWMKLPMLLKQRQPLWLWSMVPQPQSMPRTCREEPQASMA